MYNLAEYSTDWYQTCDAILATKIKGKVKVFEGINPSKTLINELPDEKITIYMTDPARIIPEILKWVDELYEIKVFAVKSEIYNFEIKKKKKKNYISKSQ